MFKNSKLNNKKIKQIIRHFCVDIQANQTAELLNINRNTINRYFKLFREIIFDHQMQECKNFYGEIEIDESYFGARRSRGNAKRGRGTAKQPVFGIFERQGRVYTEIIPDCTKRTLQSLILGKIAVDSIINSDKWRGYDGLVDVGYDKHYRVNHAKNQFAKNGGVHINGIESFWSFCKRRLLKFNGVKKYFALHLKESEWRWKRTADELENSLIKLIKTYKGFND